MRGRRERDTYEERRKRRGERAKSEARREKRGEMREELNKKLLLFRMSLIWNGIRLCLNFWHLEHLMWVVFACLVCQMLNI